MAKIHPITDVTQWQELWSGVQTADAATILVLKRSPICPTSFFAEAIFNRFVGELPENPKLRIFSVDVIGARPVSQRIAVDTGIHHESPQAMLIKGGRHVAWNASHGAINDDALAANVPTL